MKKTILVGLVLMAMVGLYVFDGHAGDASGTLNVTATVTTACAVDTSDGAVFGDYVAGQGTEKFDDITVDVTCGSTTTFTLTFGQGSAYTASEGWRMADGGGNFLDYDIELDTCIAETGTPIAALTDYGTSATTFSFAGCAILPGGQSVNPGAYSDAITVDISW